MTKTTIYFKDPSFDCKGELVYIGQRLLQDNIQQSKTVLQSMARQGYSFCVVADRTEYRDKVDISYEFRNMLVADLKGLPVLFAEDGAFAGLKYAIDTDLFDRIDYQGEYEDVVIRGGKKQRVPKYIINSYIFDAYAELKRKPQNL
ncbi:hypothetical protein D1Q00_gp122 [Trichoplusia ni granulovirus LBIV-12]|jgi:hypothetical protein|uniref:Uncharacterized protein n=2 Tax=Betabaculovirus TaxID=558017 RepID=A0A1D8QLE9_GVTN|nr:hypothetical protein PsunGV_gp132 [Pseudalatia unipuncta granulovirus]YP_009506192.1 hypothetical protein D1Q00_gp122 [Trichoplusia ni granulovirus LBIV-12]ACH69482.1 unknown [Pseudalatia unipuncta granulovirus]AOW41460.1 hypothetical protein [Trichoplusia ni granulovirus LBIV-12]